jgi:type IV pilus assembly protein PilQ
MKRLLTFASMTLLSCGISMGATFGPQAGASTPDAEFVTLSDMASMPIAATAGDALAPVQPAAAPQETAVAPQGVIVETTGGVSSVEEVTNNGVPVMATGTVDIVIQKGGEAAASNVVTSADTSTELMPVASFTGGSEKQNLISVALDDVPLQDVVRLFTRISGANIISSSTNLQGKVTVNLQDVEWKPALDSILDMYSLMVSEKVPGSGIYSVMTKVPGAEPLIAQPIFLNYAQVSNVVAVVQTMLGKGGSVSAFPNANALIVRATAADLSSIIKVVTEIDVPRQQVYIEAKFLELSDEAIKDLGVNWQVLEGYGIGAASLTRTLNDSVTKVNGNQSSSAQTDSRSSSDVLNGNNSSVQANSTVDGLSSTVSAGGGQQTSDSIKKSMDYTKNVTKNRDQTITDVRTAVLSADEFRVVLSALQQINGISIVSNPKIIVANEETATIHIGQNQPNIKGTVTAGQQGQANTTTYALDTVKPYFEFGISLEVTPTINNQSNISVRISPTLSRYVKDLDAPDGTKYPIEATKKIKTVFSLENGKTAAIGGLTETTDQDNVIKIPLLGDIPLIGKLLFTHTHKQHLQTETIIFVTVGLANPRTVQSEEGLPEETSLSQGHMIKSKQARDQRKADALKVAEKEKAAALKVASKAKANGAGREPTP